MKHLYYLIPILLIIAFLSKGCNYEDPIVTSPQENFSPEFSDGPIDTGLSVINYNKSYSTNLITSNNTNIGTLNVRLDSVNFYFKFTATSQYYFKNIHLGVSQLLNRIPVNGNCPSHENFNYVVHNLPVNSRVYTFTIPTSTFYMNINTLFVSAETDFENSSDGPMGPILPNPVDLCATGKATSDGYWEFDLSNAGFLDGHHIGWCIDANRGGVAIQNPCTSPYATNVYSSYASPLPPPILNNVSYTQNLDLINWIINNFTPGTSVAMYDYSGTVHDFYGNLNMGLFQNLNQTGIVTSGDIQVAIWLLIEETQGTGTNFMWERTFGIVHAALMSGEGFVPVQGQQLGLLMIPYVSGIMEQPIIAGVPFNGTTCQFAWAKGVPFPGCSEFSRYFGLKYYFSATGH